MVKYILLALISSTIIFPKEVSAELVTIKNNGDMVVNVLSMEDGSSLEVKKIANTNGLPDSVTIKRENEKVEMSVMGSTGSEQMDVTNYKENLVEIEEVIKPKKTIVGVDEDRFFINQGSITATTLLPVTIQAEDKRIALETSTGLVYLGVMPQRAAEAITKTRIISKLNSDNALSLETDDSGNLNYVVHGKKVINILNVYDWEVDVVARVSALTGELVEIDTPDWLRSINFLFV